MKDSDMAKNACRLWIKKKQQENADNDKQYEDIKHDVMGSYTGISQDDPCEAPVQDADDL